MRVTPITAEQPAFQPGLAAPRHWPIWIGIGLLRALAALPHGLRLRLGAAIGSLLRRVLGSREAVARRNLELCFPEHDAAWREQVIAAMFGSLGCMVLEIGFAWWGSERRHRPLMTLRGLDRVRAAQADGQGVLLLFCHFTSLELAGRLLAYELSMAGLYREHGNPVLEYLVRRCRLRYGEALFNRNQLRGMVRYLRGGGVLWYAPDQDYQRGENVFAPFFGIAASTTTSTHQLARLGRARVMITSNRRTADGRYEIEVRDTLGDLAALPPEQAAARINQAVEELVRECPEQYLWIHRRFKTRPPGEPSRYD